MLQIKDLHYSIGDLHLLCGVDWIINPGQRVALIGRNGAGKTTLLKIITSDLQPERGNIQRPKGYQIGYLPQEQVSIHQTSILEAVLEGNREIVQIEEEIRRIHQQLEEQDNQQGDLLEKLGTLEERYKLLGGYQLESQAKAILSGLGFNENDFHRQLTEFSGGWRMRVLLARLLLQDPDLLLLDEPTNHLDLEALEWLEQYLMTFQGSIVIVSHDRFFIDRLASEIVELKRGKLTHYAGNYHFYEQQKVLNEERLIKKWEEQKAERERIQRFIDRFRYKASKAAQVQSRIKELEKMEKIEIPPTPRKIHFNIRVETPSYKEVLKIEEMSFRYEQAWVLENINLKIYRGDRIALVGVNGAGKTTFTRLISSELSPQKGRIELGERTFVGYYAQHQADTLTLDSTVFEEVSATAAESFLPNIRDVLGLFQFSNDDPEKRIDVLSGGEKARVSLAKILLSPVNFLIMDEPTNHLDIQSKEALEDALEGYDGTLLLISHDRYFLDKLVNRVIEIKDGGLREYEGNYTDYLQRRASRDGHLGRTEPIYGKSDSDSKMDVTAPSKKRKEQKRIEAEARQKVSKERHRLQNEIAYCENRIQELEQQKVDLEKFMADPKSYQDGEHAASLQKEYSAVKDELTELFERWENSQIEYEALMEKLGQS